MNNWIENNQTKSVIIYTLTIIGAVWAFSYFILDENKDKKHSSEINLLRSQIDSYKQRIDVLENENIKIQEKNDKYINWLVENPSTFQHLESKIKNLQQELHNNKNNIINNKENIEFAILNEGKSYYVQDLGLFVGINNINVLKETSGEIKFPNNKTEKFNNETAGKSWSFTYKNQEYNLLLSEVNYVNSLVKFIIEEK